MLNVMDVAELFDYTVSLHVLYFDSEYSKLQAPGGRTKDMWQQLQAQQQHVFDDSLSRVAVAQWQPQRGKNAKSIKIPILFALNVLTAFIRSLSAGCYT